MAVEVEKVSLETNFKTNRNFLRALALKLSRNADDADDLLQETWLRVIENYSGYDNRNKFRAWASVIMKNIFVNNFRKNKRQGQSVDVEEAHVSVYDDSDYLLVKGDIYKAISQLPHEMAKVFYMYLQGYSYEEISVLEAIPLGTVKSRIFCAKKRLQVLLESYSKHA